MEDPKYNASIKVGSKDSSYSFLAFPRGATGGLQASQSFILELTFTDEQTPGQPFDISGSTTTLYCTGYNVQGFDVTMLGAGVLSDSGSGTTDRVTFTVTKDQIPDELGNLPATKNGNSVFYCILEDADTKLQFYQTVNVLDQDFQLTGENSVSDNIILAGGNDLGTVIDTQIATPPVSPVLNDAYIVATAGTGDWSGKDGQLAVFNGSDWIFRTPETGNFVYDSTADTSYSYDGAAWNTFTPAADSITNTELANMAEGTLKGVPTGAGTSDPQDVPYSTVKADLSLDNVDNTADTDKPVSTAQQAALDLKVNNSDVGIAQFNADQLNSVPLNDTGLSSGYIWYYDGGTNEWKVKAESAGGSGIIDVPYSFSTTTTIGGLASGEIRYNSATPGSITEIYVHAFNADGLDINSLITPLDGGNRLLNKQDGTKLGIFSVTSVTDNGDNTFTLSVSPGTQGALPDNAASISLSFFYISSGAAGLIDFNGRTTPSVIPAAGDYALSQINNDSAESGVYGSDAINNLRNREVATGEGLQGGGNLNANRTFKLDINSLTTEATPAAGDFLVIWDGANHKKVDWSDLPGSGGGGGLSYQDIAEGQDNNQTGTSYTLVLTDADLKTVWMNNASANTVTIPTNASVAFPVGTKINIMREGAGGTTLQADTGVTLNGVVGGSVGILQQYDGATISKRATNTWIVTGGIA